LSGNSQGSFFFECARLPLQSFRVFMELLGHVDSRCLPGQSKRSVGLLPEVPGPLKQMVRHGKHRPGETTLRWKRAFQMAGCGAANT
jgi:hypothetical protein